MHAASPEPRYCPLVHNAHSGEPTNDDVPSAHGVHKAEPAESEYVPATQAIQPSAAASPEPRY